MRKNMKLVSVVVAAAAVVSLAGCSSHSMEDAKQHSYSVVELTNASLTGPSTFAYVDPEGTQKPLPHCGQPDIFSARYCATKDGLVRFEYTTAKGKLRNTSITVDGHKHDLDCAYKSEDTWGGLEVCIPTN